MVDDLDVGISVRTNPADIQNAERASDAVEKFAITTEQARALMAKAGGDFEKYKQLLRELVTGQQAATAAAQQQAQATQQTAAAAQTATTAQAAQTAGQRAATQATTQATTAAQQNATAQTQVAQATVQAGNAVAAAAQKTVAIIPPANAAAAAIQKIPAGARTAANALSIISLSAATGTGSLSGFANAAGAAAFGLSQLSGNATLVASAAGLGAVVTVVGVLIGLFETFERRREAVSKGLGDLSRDIGRIGVDALQGRLRATDETIKRLEQQRASLDAATRNTGGLRFAPGNDPRRELDALSQANSSIEAIDKRLTDLYQQRAALAKATAEQQAAAEKELTETTIKANEAALESYLRRTRGEIAARRQAITFELREQEAAIRQSGDTEAKQQAALKAVRDEAREQRAALDQEEAEREAQARAQTEVRLAKILSDTQVQASKEAAERSEAVNAEQRTRRLISEREYIKTRETLELESIGREEFARLQSIDTQIAAQRKLLEATSEPAKKTQITGEITALTDQRNAVISGARQQMAKVQGDAVRDQAELARKLAEAIQQAERETLEASGRFAEAAVKEIHRSLDDLIREAEQAGNAVGAAMLTAQRNVQLQQAAVREIDAGVSRATTGAENKIARVNALLSVHAISTRQAKQEIVGALEAERDAIAAAIPALERQRDLVPGDTETLAKIDAYRTHIAELNAEITKLADPLFAFKEAAIGASGDALAGFFEGLKRLGRQDTSQIRALSADLQSTKDELNELLAIPAEQRTSTTNTRITELRNEIEATSASLDNAKQSITTWRDLFVDALQSIADALVRVSSQMLATALIEKLLGLAIGSAIGASTQTLSGDVAGPGVGRVNVATGGLIEGPGTATSDSVPAMLSAGEYVVNARRASQFLPLLQAINFDPDPPAVVVPKAARRHYAGGGLVESAAASRFGAESGAPLHLVVSVRDSNDHIVEVAERYHRSPAGRNVTIEHVRNNPRQLGL